MENIRLANFAALWYLWALPFLCALYVYCFYRKKRLLGRFVSDELSSRINGRISFNRQISKAVLLLLAAASIIIALTQPGWNPRPEKIQRKGRDVVVLLDVSRSMLAEDLNPNRLEQAKLAIGDLLDELDGDRIAVVAFAGTRALKCPLTQDYGFVRMTLSEITPDCVSQGGTIIGDAIRMACDDVFDQEEKDYKDIILITDGEDQDSYPVEAAAKAAEQGIRIFAIGLGDENQGSRIPITDKQGRKTFLKYKDKEVRSKLDGDKLRDIAYATPGGSYLPVATGMFDLAELYRSTIAGADQKALQSTTVMRYEEKFQVFLALALVLIVAESMVRETNKVIK